MCMEAPGRNRKWAAATRRRPIREERGSEGHGGKNDTAAADRNEVSGGSATRGRSRNDYDGIGPVAEWRQTIDAPGDGERPGLGAVRGRERRQRGCRRGGAGGRAVDHL